MEETSDSKIICLRCGLKCEVGLGKDHRHFRSRMDAIVQNMFEINYSRLIQYEILEKLVTYMRSDKRLFGRYSFGARTKTPSKLKCYNKKNIKSCAVRKSECFSLFTLLLNVHTRY